MKLRSIELEMPDPKAAYAFLTGVWGAHGCAHSGPGQFVRGTGCDAYLVGLFPAPVPAVRSITFVTDRARVDALAAAAQSAGCLYQHVKSGDPGGGSGVEIQLPEGERFRFLADSRRHAPRATSAAPVQLTHVVLNAVDAEASAVFCETVLGFRVTDRTSGMVFVRCNEAHHAVAFARAGFASLNHIAFEMADIDAVMQGMGRMRDAGHLPSWGPGRHGPGANVFAYFVAPFGAVVEFSTAVEKVGDDYRAGTPEDWTWPPGRIDRWGISEKDVRGLYEAEKRFRFAAALREGNRP